MQNQNRSVGEEWHRRLTRFVRSLEVLREPRADEEAMLAVSRGESDECDGWTCGEASEYDPPPKAKKKAR